MQPRVGSCFEFSSVQLKTPSEASAARRVRQQGFGIGIQGRTQATIYNPAKAQRRKNRYKQTKVGMVALVALLALLLLIFGSFYHLTRFPFICQTRFS